MSADPGRELTVISDQPTTGYVTTRFADAGNGRTQIQRSFLWELPDDPVLAEGIQQMLGTMVQAGEDAIREIFEPSVA